jgi:hypothetical protein
MMIRLNKAHAVIIIILFTPMILHARSNSIDVGLSVSYDFDDRQYEAITLEQTTDVIQPTTPDDEYRNIIITPLIRYISTGHKDNFELNFAPSLNYDTIESENNWDVDLLIAVDRSINHSWRVIGSNALVHSDYHETTPGSTTETIEDSSPELSGDYGRSRYWRNNLSLDSEHHYSEDNLVNIGFDYVILRNDESEVRSYDDYDRYVGSITNGHNFNKKWNIVSDLSVVRGDFETIGPLGILTDEDTISDDLNEYRLISTLANNYNRQVTLGLTYDYIGTRYDESIRVDNDIHQLQLTYTYLLSRQTTITVGAGPSYEKAEEQDNNIGGNGIVEYEYLGQHSNIVAGVEKRYDVDNFSGTSERGFIDYWDTYFTYGYQMTPNLTVDSELRYRNEDREQLFSPTAISLESEDLVLTEEYNTEYYTFGLGLSYDFLRHYTTSIGYTFTKQESEKIGDTYDDHRILLTLSWEQNWLRW